MRAWKSERVPSAALFLSFGELHTFIQRFSKTITQFRKSGRNRANVR